MAAAAIPLLASAGGVAGAATAAGTLSTIATVASVGMSLYSGISAMQAGKAEAAQYRQQAEMESLRAQQEESNRQVKLTEILNSQMAQFAGRGIQLGSGSDVAITDFSIEEAARESEMAGMDSQFRQSQSRQSASQAKKAGTAGLLSGLADAAKTGYGAYTSAQERKLSTGNKI